MNQDALSLTGLRLGIFSQIYLILQEFDESSQTYDTKQEDIYNIFLEASRLEAQVTESSHNPVTSSAVFAHIAALLLQYRRNDEDIPMADISGLLQHLQTYRPLTNVTFPNLVSQGSISYDGGTDLTTTINALDGRLTQDEGELHDLAIALAGTDFMSSTSAKENWLQTHVRDYVLDSVLKSSKLHQVYETANEWTISWGMMNHYLVSLTSTNRGYMPDQTWAGYSTREICNRFVYKRFRFQPSGLWTPFNPVPAGDFFPTDMNCVHYNDIEVRGESSFLCGHGSQEGKFRFKAVTSYYPDASSQFPQDPLAVGTAQDLLIMDPSGANFHVHVNAPSLSIGGIAVQPGGGSSDTYNTYHTINTDQHFTQNITRKHLHSHNNVNAGDQYFHYTAPSRTIINRSVNHQIQTFHEQTVRQTINKTFKSTRVVPSQFFTEFNFFHQKRTVAWDSVLLKPDFDTIFADINTQMATKAAQTALDALTIIVNGKANQTALDALSVTVNGKAAQSALDDLTTVVDTKAAQAELDALTITVNGKANSSDLDDYYNKQTTDTLLGQRVDYTWANQQLGMKQHVGDYATNTTLTVAVQGKANISEVYAKTETYSQTEVNGLVGDKITLAGLMFTLRPFLYKTDEYSNGLRINWKNEQNQDQNMILVRLSTFEALETKVIALEARVEQLETQFLALTSAQSVVEYSTFTITQDITNLVQRLEAIGA